MGSVVRAPSGRNPFRRLKAWARGLSAAREQVGVGGAPAVVVHGRHGVGLGGRARELHVGTVGMFAAAWCTEVSRPRRGG